MDLVLHDVEGWDLPKPDGQGLIFRPDSDRTEVPLLGRSAMLDTARKNGTLHSRCLRLNRPFQHSARWVCSSWTLRLSLGFDLSIPSIFWMTIWICHEKSFRSHISAPGCRSFWNPLVRSELANFSVQANSTRLFSCKTHEIVWKHKFGESTTTFSNFQCHLLMHFSFSSKMGWFPVYLWFNIDYHGFIIDLSFVYPKSEFRPSKHQKSPLTSALSRPGDHVQKGHGKCIGKAGATINLSGLSGHDICWTEHVILERQRVALPRDHPSLSVAGRLV